MFMCMYVCICVTCMYVYVYNIYIHIHIRTELLPFARVGCERGQENHIRRVCMYVFMCMYVCICVTCIGVYT